MFARKCKRRAAAAPSFSSTTVSNITSANTSYSPTLPATYDTGDFLLCVVGCEIGSEPTAHSGWTKVTWWEQLTTAGGIYYRVATGSDTLTFTWSSRRARAHVLRITGSVDSANIGISSNNGSAAAINPPSINVTATPTLFIAGGMVRASGLSGSLTDYTVFATDAAASGRPAHHIGHRQATVSTEDPEPGWSWTTAANCIEYTLALPGA